MSGYHPCDRFSCPEWNQGQCFGGGCSINPMREDDEEREDEERDYEEEVNEEWFGNKEENQ